MSFSSAVRHAWAGPLAVVLLAAPAPAAVEYLSQSYRVVAGTEEDAATAAPGRTLSATAEENNADFRTAASATQDVTVGDDGLRLSGVLSLDVEQFTNAQSSTGSVRYEDVVRFSIDEPYNFRFVHDNTTEQRTGELDTGLDYRLVGPGDSDPDVVFDTNAGGEAQGRLEPGEYSFRIQQDIFAETVFEGTRVDNYDVRLDLTQIGGGGGNGGGGPNPIPLPPAVWSGLVTMGGGALVQWARGRRRA